MLINTVLNTKASASLDKEVQEELNVPDPEPVKAASLLEQFSYEEVATKNKCSGEGGTCGCGK